MPNIQRISKSVLITGASGLLGSHLFKILAEREEARIFLLIRGRNHEEITNKYKSLVSFLSQYNVFNLNSKIDLIGGDITFSKLFYDDCHRQILAREINEIYHCAAATGFSLPLSEARKVNLEGTKNVLDFSLECKNLTKVNYISTTFLIGNKECIFDEKCSITQRQKFNNTYEQSKYEAEQLVNRYKQRGLDVSIFRPSIIAGDYFNGRTNNFKMLYEPLHFFSREIFDKAPLNINSLHNLIPVDIAAENIYLLSKRLKERNGIYHIISKNNISFGDFMELASEYFGFRNPLFIPVERFNFDDLTYVQKRILKPFICYFNYKTIFNAEDTFYKLNRMGAFLPTLDSNFLVRLFRYCCCVGFIRKKEK